MYSQCPTCKAIYRVSEADLAAHRGLVRCGYCSGVFNAGTNEVDGIRGKPDHAADETTGEIAAPTDKHADKHADEGRSAPSRAPGDADAAGRSHAYQDRVGPGTDDSPGVEEDHGWKAPGPDPDDQAPADFDRPLIEPVLPGARTVAERVQVEPAEEAASEPTAPETTGADEAALEAPAPEKPSPDDMRTGEPASREPVQDEAAREEATREEAAQEEAAREEAAREEAAREEAAREEAARVEAAREEAAREEAAREEAAREEAAREEAAREEAAREEAAREEAAEDEAAGDEPAGEESSSQEPEPGETAPEEKSPEAPKRAAPPVADETDLPGEITEEITIEAPPVLWNAFDEDTEERNGEDPSTDDDADPSGAVEGRREPASRVRGNLAGQAVPGAAGGRRGRRAPLRSPYGDPDIAMVELPQPRPFKTATLSLLTVLLALLLVWQVKSFYLDDLAQVSAVRPYLESLCRPLGCVLPPRRDFVRIDLVGTSIDVNPEYPGALDIQASLINRAGFPQPYPPLRVTLTDREGRVVGRRTYLPSEYRAGDGERLPVREVRNVSINLAKPAENAVGYEVELMAPLTGDEG